MGKAKNAIIAGLSIAVLAGFSVVGLRLHAHRTEALLEVPPPQKFPWALRTVPVAKRDLTTGFPVLATLSSQTEVAITPRISGAILTMGLREGQPVRKGEVLVQLDIRELIDQLAALKANVKAAEAKAALSRKDLDRQKALLKDGYTTRPPWTL